MLEEFVFEVDRIISLSFLTSLYPSYAEMYSAVHIIIMKPTG